MPRVAARASVTVLGLGLALGLMAGVPEDEVIVLVTRGAVQMPDGRLQAFLGFRGHNT